jgi:CBS domain-containing protein
MVVEDVMTEGPITVGPTTSIGDVIALLFERDVRHLPVVEGEQLVGIVSDRDLRGFLAPALMSLERTNEVRQRLSAPISSVMNADVVSVSQETELGEVIDVMLDQKVGAVPVVRPDTQDLVGIVSYVDILRAARDVID